MSHSPRAVRGRVVRLILAAIMLAGVGLMNGTLIANAGDEAKVTVSIVDEGELKVFWTGESPVFLVDGKAPTLTSFTSQVVATAAFAIQIADTRPEQTRTGYTIGIIATPFVAADGSTEITPESLSILAVEGLQGAYLEEAAVDSTLESLVSIVTVEDGATAIDSIVAITVGMTLSTGMEGDVYSGGLEFQVLPVGP